MTFTTPISPLSPPAGDEEDSDVDRMIVKALDGEPGGEAEPNGKDVDEHDDEEALIAKPLRRPTQPTATEKLNHDITHLPPRSWCRFCTEGRGIHDHHKMTGEIPNGEVPTISLDYCFMGSKSVAAAANPVLIMYDNVTGAMGAYLTGAKGPIDWVVKAVCRDLEVWGYGGCRIAVKSDQEPAIRSLREAISQRRNAPTAIIESPVRESKSNGQVEKAIQRLQGQFRTMRLSMQDSLKKTIPVQGRLSAWLTSWSATILNRYWVMKNGRTAFQMVNGHQCRRPVARFGEMVQFKLAGDHKDKAETMWRNGVFLGMNAKSIDSIISTEDGIQMARTVRARPEGESWDLDAISKLQSFV